VIGLIVSLALALPGGAAAAAPDEALRSALPTGASIERESLFLTETQLQRASELAGDEIQLELWTRYTASIDGRVVAHAYFDTHIVRTLPETLLVVVNTDGTIARVEVVAFKEPRDYRPKQAFYDQFAAHPLDDRLRLGRDLRAVTGATLSVRAATTAVRRVLAVDRAVASADSARVEAP